MFDLENNTLVVVFIRNHVHLLLVELRISEEKKNRFLVHLNISWMP